MNMVRCRAVAITVLVLVKVAASLLFEGLRASSSPRDLAPLRRARSLALLVFGALGSGCADRAPAAPQAITSARAPSSSVTSASTHVGLSEEIAVACKIEFRAGAKDTAPRFDFDQTDLLPEDREILARVAACVTTGPLRGRALRLVGHADPRGEAEYNMTLGALRAGSAFDFLTHLGVDPKKLAQSSRGEMDARGTTEESWRQDRRVDILLQ